MRLARGNDRRTACEGFLAQEALIRIHLRAFRMIDSDQPQLINIVDLFHRLAESETQCAIAGPQHRSVHFDPLVRIIWISRGWRHPVANDGSAYYVRDKLIAPAIPCKENGARAPSTIQFLEHERFGCGNIDFILRHPSRPYHTHYIYMIGFTQT